MALQLLEMFQVAIRFAWESNGIRYYITTYLNAITSLVITTSVNYVKV